MYNEIVMRSDNNIKEEYILISNKTKTRDMVVFIKEEYIVRKYFMNKWGWYRMINNMNKTRGMLEYSVNEHLVEVFTMKE